MGDNSRIEWTDATWNPVRGCTKVSAGCDNCYAMRQAHRFSGPGQPYEGLTREINGRGQWNGKITLVPELLDQPLSWQTPRRIFVTSMSDLFHPGVPDDFIDQVFAVMALAQQHTFQVLTKRPQRMRHYLTTIDVQDRIEVEAFDMLDVRSGRDAAEDRDLAGPPWPLPNVWLGVSVENQATADERVPLLLDTPAAVRWLSCEPLLGQVDLFNGDPDPRLGHHHKGVSALGEWWEPGDDPTGPPRRGVDWVVVGGESGPGARPMHPDWARSLRDQCVAAGVPFFMKQITEKGRKVPMDRWPDDLRIQEYPHGL